MAGWFKDIAGYIALALEAAAVASSQRAAHRFFRELLSPPRVDSSSWTEKEIWVRFGTWLMMALTFELAADITS